MEASVKHTYLKFAEDRDQHGVDLTAVGNENVEHPLVADGWIGKTTSMKSWSKSRIGWFMTYSPELDKITKGEEQLQF